VRHGDHRGAEVAVDVADGGEHLVATLVVELAGRLVQQQQPWTGGQADADRQPLALPRRECGQGGVRVVAEPDHVQHLTRLGQQAGIHLVVAAPDELARAALGEPHVVDRGRVGEQVAHRPLQHDADVAGPHPGQAALVHPGDLVRPDGQPAGARPQQPGEQVEQRRLPRPGRAEQTDHLAGGHVEVDAGQRHDVVALQPVDVHQAVGRDGDPAHSGAPAAS
jgi:hypothetical protein